VDEAHSSQTGEMAVTVKELLSDSSLAAKLEEEGEDISAPDQLALRAALFRGPRANMGFFAFTATPKHKTLEMLGHKGPDGKPAPFHLYSMRQAIEKLKLPAPVPTTGNLCKGLAAVRTSAVEVVGCAHTRPRQLVRGRAFLGQFCIQRSNSVAMSLLQPV